MIKEYTEILDLRIFVCFEQKNTCRVEKMQGAADFNDGPLARTV